MFDHVVMGFPTDTREAPMYPPKMPILEALMALSHLAAVTERIGLGTEVLVLPQRQPVLVAKQVSTLDTLSGGRVRLGIGVGWQEFEYDALEEDFRTRGRRMDEAIELMRAYWSDEQIDHHGAYYSSTTMAMEPKPPSLAYGRGHFFVVDNIDRKVYAYDDAGRHAPALDFDLAAGNLVPGGITLDADRFYVVDEDEITEETQRKVFVYDASGEHLPSADFKIGVGIREPLGISFFDDRLFVADAWTTRVYAYRRAVHEIGVAGSARGIVPADVVLDDGAEDPAHVGVEAVLPVRRNVCWHFSESGRFSRSSGLAGLQASIAALPPPSMSINRTCTPRLTQNNQWLPPGSTSS